MPGPGITRVEPTSAVLVDRFGNTTVNPDAPVAVYPEQGKIEVPKPQEILDLEQKLGREVEPVYATGEIGGYRPRTVEYGPPIGYRYDNGKSQYVNFDTKGTQTGIQQRGGQLQMLLPIAACKAATATGPPNVAATAVATFPRIGSSPIMVTRSLEDAPVV